MFFPRSLLQQAERLKASGVPLPIDLYHKRNR